MLTLWWVDEGVASDSFLLFHIASARIQTHPWGLGVTSSTYDIISTLHLLIWWSDRNLIVNHVKFSLNSNNMSENCCFVSIFDSHSGYLEIEFHMIYSKILPREQHQEWITCNPFESTHHKVNINGEPGRVAQSVERLTQEPGVPTYFSFSFRWFKKGSCQLLTKVCSLITG